MYFTTIQRVIYFFFTRFSHTRISENCTLVIFLTFATELSTKLVYKSIFVIDYNYISNHLLFFFTEKLSIFSRLCVNTQNNDEHVNTHWDLEILHW